MSIWGGLECGLKVVRNDTKCPPVVGLCLGSDYEPLRHRGLEAADELSAATPMSGHLQLQGHRMTPAA